MEETKCSSCGVPLEAHVPSLGQRLYCTACHDKIMRDRRGLWWAGLPGIAALVAFVAVVALILGQIETPLEGPPLVATGVIMALVPALFWLAFFYAQDVREPEPKQYVLAVFVLGALLAQAAGIPLVRDVFRVSDWLTASRLTHILGSILVVGFTQQFLIYGAVRYSIYLSSEFDERVDGIVYCVAAALGYATMANINYVTSSGGVDLAVGIIRVAANALALASLGGVVGFFLGRCKFEDEPLWWMPAGLALAATVNGLFFYLWSEATITSISLRGGGYNPWPGLALAAVVASATFGILYFLTRRLSRQGLPAKPA